MKKTVSAILLAMLLTSMLCSVFKIMPVEAAGTIYIRADGSIDPATAPISTVDNVTYTFTGDVYDSIVVERNSIVVDGSGYTVQGTGAANSMGMDLTGRSNVTIKNTQIKVFDYGVMCSYSSGSSISGNNITANNYYGIGLADSSNNSVSGNNITANNYSGIELWSSSNYNSVSGNNITANNYSGISLQSSSNNSLSGNNITANNMYGIGLHAYSNYNSISGNTFTNDGFYVWDSYQNSVENNTVNGRPLVYLEGVSNYTVDDAGQVILVRCDNITVEGLNLSSTSFGVELWETGNSSISGNTIANNYCGVYLSDSSNYNSISGNNITANNYSGISLQSLSNYNSVSGNNITANNMYGIGLADSSNNSVSGNTFTNDGLYVSYSYQNSVENNTVNGRPLVYLEGVSNYTVDDAGQVILVRCDNITVEGLNLSSTSFGVELWETGNSSISGNTIANNGYGIRLHYSSDNSISGNNITNNRNGIWLRSSSGSSIFHNNFINNARQAYSLASVNVWDDGYPSGGNYWSDYTGTDADHDGIGDTPYVIDGLNQDNYPLMNPFRVIPGDINNDGIVDIFDIVIVALEFGHPPPPIVDLRADVNKDGLVDIFDIAIVAIHFGETG